MKKKCSPVEKDCSQKRKVGKGSALVVVLILSSLLAVILVGLLFLAEEEGQRASSFLVKERAQLYLHIAFQEVKAKLMDGGEIPYRDGVAQASMTACPGLMEVRRYDVLPNRGYQIGREAFLDPDSFFRKPFSTEYERQNKGNWQPANPVWISLYSQKWYAPFCKYMTAIGSMEKQGPAKIKDKNPDYNPERVFNLNTPDNPFHPGKFYLGGASEKSAGIKSVSLEGEYANKQNAKHYRYRMGESAVERPVYIQWIPVYQDARYGAIKPDKSRNPIIGRYAYWVDVENTKIKTSSVKREWEQTILGKLTGKSDAERGMERGDYFQQWGEKKEDTLRSAVERYLPRTYKLFADKIDDHFGVDFYYRANYGRPLFLEEEKSGGGQTETASVMVEIFGNEYEYQIDVHGEKDKESNQIKPVIPSYADVLFKWEKEFPPAIAESSVVDRRALSALLPYRERIGAEISSAFRGGDHPIFSEIYALLDPLVEKRNSSIGSMGVNGLQKMYGQALTLYGWEEERDPLGRPKLDVNAILREGNALFDQGEGLPRANHYGTPLQQLLARTEDPKYYSAYYPGAYPSEGRPLSFLDGLRAFAGRGADADRYARTVRDQMVTNMIEYGRAHEDPPFIDTDRGIIGAKSMPYVTEVAIRARNAFWDLWDYPFIAYGPNPNKIDPKNYNTTTKIPSYFPGLYESELVYSDNFQKTKEEAKRDLALAQQIAYWYLRGDGFTRSGATDEALLNRELMGGYADRVPFLSSVFGLPYFLYTLRELLTHVVIDTAFALANPNPYGRGEVSEWEIEMDYSWFDPKQGDWMINAGHDFAGYLLTPTNSAFHKANGTKKHTLKVTMEDKDNCPYLLPGKNRVNQLGYFFQTHHPVSAAHPLIYFRPRPKIPLFGKDLPSELDTGVIPGELLDGFDDLGKRRGALQSFRLWGWRIYRKDEEHASGKALYHEVPIRHPGQQAEPRKFWEMTVDRDGGGPEPPPNAGVLAASKKSTYGLKTKEEFYYPDFHSLEHFRRPSESPLGDVNGSHENAYVAPFNLGIREREDWEALNQRKEVATSWFSSQTIAEFGKHCDSLMATIPPGEGSEQLMIYDDLAINSKFSPLDFTAPKQYFYHVEEALVAQGKPSFRGLEGKLYMPERAMQVYEDWTKPGGDVVNRHKIRSDIIRFMLLQMKLRDEGLHNREVAKSTEREQESTGRERDDEFVSGMALVERLVCIDPVLGHRTGNPDLRIERDGQTYSGHFYGVNGHPWRRYHYYFHHYDKDSNSPQAEVLGGRQRPEPDRCLTWHFRDPRRTDGESEPIYEEKEIESEWDGIAKEYQFHYTAFNPRKIPLHSLTGSVLFDAVLTKGGKPPDLRGALGLSQVSDIEEDGVHVWPYGPGMNVNYGYGEGALDNRQIFRRGSFLTHSPRGELMVSIGEIGMCHSGLMQRVIDLDRPPLFASQGVKQLGAPQYGPPMSMLLDLVIPSNFKDDEGNVLSKKKWERGKYRMLSPENPREGTWNVNSQVAHDNYLAMREGAHGVMNDEAGDFFANGLERVPLHPALVPNAVGQRIDGNGVTDPYLSPLIRFRRGWEQWLGAISGDYSEYRNRGIGVWGKEKGNINPEKEGVYTIAHGTQSFSWHPGGTKWRQIPSPYIRFHSDGGGEGNLFALGREPLHGLKKSDWSGLAGHLSADGPVYEEGKQGVEMLKNEGYLSLYDVTRFGLFPLIHHHSEIGYTGLGQIHTALNARGATTPAQGEFWGEEKMVDEKTGGDGILGGMSQAGFARNAAWVMSANQMSTSANVFTVHIVVQSIKDKKSVERGSRFKDHRELAPLISKKPRTINVGIGYLDAGDEVLGEQWAQMVVARVPKRNQLGHILTDEEGAPQHNYRVLSEQVRENLR